MAATLASHDVGTVLITGAAGFIGQALARRLVHQGRPVLGVDRRAPGPRPPFPFELWEIGDIRRLDALIEEFAIERIVHCGAVSGPMLGRDQPHATCRVNIMGTADVLELARVHGLKRFVYCSSCAVYGDTGAGPVTEDAPIAATDIYGSTKAAGDLIVRAFCAQFDVDAVCLRICWAYGPGRTAPCVIRTMLEDALSGRPTRLEYGDGFFRQFIYIEDVVDAVIAALDADEVRQRAYNVTGGERIALDALGNMISEALPAADILLGQGPDPHDSYQELFEISAIGHDLGWQPRTPLERGIRRYSEWLQKAC
jgi:nucleoside-diphosphate-sugar epimerase